MLCSLRATAHTEHGTTVLSILSWKSVMPQALFKQYPFISNKESRWISWSKIRSPESIQAPLLTLGSKMCWYWPPSHDNSQPSSSSLCTVATQTEYCKCHGNCAWSTTSHQRAVHCLQILEEIFHSFLCSWVQFILHKPITLHCFPEYGWKVSTKVLCLDTWRRLLHHIGLEFVIKGEHLTCKIK